MFEVKNVSKTYGTKKEKKKALEDITFSLPDNGLFALVGKSGSGKSTLLNIIFGSEKATAGEILIDGNRVSRLRQKETEYFRNSYCSFVYQHFNLFEDMTAFENVAMPLLLKGDNREEITTNVNALFKEYSLEYLKEKKTSLLSGGEKQRIAFLRAIITKPKILLADEPTGALDEENEKIIMRYLKEASKHSLVIIVTHNEKIVNEYCDDYLRLEDGKIIKNYKRYKSSDNRAISFDKKKKNSSWTRKFIIRNYKKNIFKNIFSIVVGTLGYLSLLISLGFYNGSKNLLEKEKSNTLTYLNASLSKKVSFQVEGSPLSLTRSERPSVDESNEYLSSFKSVNIANDYSYFLPTYHSFTMNGFPSGMTSIIPIEDISLKNRSNDFLLEGELPSGNTLNYCLVNKEFLDEFDEKPIGKTIRIKNEVSVQKDDVVEAVTIDFSMLVIGVVKEFSFLNSSKIYYSYPSFENLLLRKELPKFSMTLGEFLSEEEYNSNYFSYSLNIFFSEDDAKGLEELAKRNDELTITSTSFEINSSFESLYQSFSESLLPFLFIEIFGVGFVIFSMAYHSFLERRREMAILSSLGARKSDLRNVYQSEQVINGLINASVSLTLSFPLEILLSKYLEKKVMLSSLISIPYLSYMGFPLFSIVACFAFSLLIGFFGSAFPFFISRKRNLLEELRDE